MEICICSLRMIVYDDDDNDSDDCQGCSSSCLPIKLSYAVLCWLSGDRLDASRFQSPGINYKGKLIGVEDVPGPSGDKMCQVAMAKVKAVVKTIGEHKLKIVMNISLDGIRIVEEKSEVCLDF